MARIKSYHIRDFDWISFALTLILVGIGLVAVYSATYRVDQPYSPFFYKQLIWLHFWALSFISFLYLPIIALSCDGDIGHILSIIGLAHFHTRQRTHWHGRATMDQFRHYQSATI